MPIDNQPDPTAQRKTGASGGTAVAVIEQADAGNKVKASTRTKTKAGRNEIPSVKEVAARP